MLIKNNYINKKKNYSFFFYFNFIIRIYLKKLFNQKSIILSDIIIKKRLNTFLIYIYINKNKKLKINKNKIEKNINNYLLVNNFSLSSKIFLINLNIKFFKKSHEFYKIFKFYKNQKKIYNLLFVISIALYSKNPKFLNLFLIKNLEKIKNHTLYLRTVNNILKNFFIKYKNLLGYKIQLKGRVNGVKRARKIAIQSGQIPLTTLNLKIQLDSNKILTRYGICSLKTWLFFSN